MKKQIWFCIVSCALPPGLVKQAASSTVWSSNPGVIAAGAARAGGSARLQAAIALQATPASDGLALGGGRGAGPAVTADGHGVGVERVDPRGTVG